MGTPNLPVAAPDHAQIVLSALVGREPTENEWENVPALAALRVLLAERQQDKERIERGKRLALGVLAFCREAASELDGGGLGYELAGVAADAQALLDDAALAVEEDAE